jgi:glycosyltransferase involved in cell wall biosynthesis
VSKISVVVPHLNDLDNLVRCIAALEAQSLPRGDIELIVADNGSACGLAEVAARVPTARVVHAVERGAGPARNCGVAACDGDLLAFTDSDCLPDPNWLAAGIAGLGTSDVVGGQMQVSVRSAARMSGAEAFETVFAFDNETYVHAHGFSVTANLITTRAVFQRTGPFATGISEDLAWCRAAVRCGHRIAYCPGAIVTHPARATYKDLAGKWQRLTVEAHGLWRAEGRGRLVWTLRAMAVLCSPVPHALRVMGSTRLPNWATRLRALMVLLRIRSARCLWMLRLAYAAPVSPSIKSITVEGAPSYDAR